MNLPFRPTTLLLLLPLLAAAACAPVLPAGEPLVVLEGDGCRFDVYRVGIDLPGGLSGMLSSDGEGSGFVRYGRSAADERNGNEGGVAVEGVIRWQRAGNPKGIEPDPVPGRSSRTTSAAVVVSLTLAGFPTLPEDGPQPPADLGLILDRTTVGMIGREALEQVGDGNPVAVVTGPACAARVAASLAASR